MPTSPFPVALLLVFSASSPRVLNVPGFHLNATVLAERGDSGVVPRFEPGACTIPSPQGERVDCGQLVVWENRAHRDGPVVRIPVKIFRSRATIPKPDPILFMVGGPGGSARTAS